MKKKIKLTSIIVSLLMIFQICFADICHNIVHAASNQVISFVYNGFNNQAMRNMLYLQSDATFVNGSLRLTRKEMNLKGSAFYKQKVVVSSDKSFSTFFTFRAQPSELWHPADGLVFVLDTSTRDIGLTGAAIGYGGIKHSLGIEFDTFRNDGYDSTTGIPDMDDPNDNHIGIDLDGDPRSKVTRNLDEDNIELADGNEKYAWVDYNGNTNKLEVRISNSISRPHNPSLSYTVNINDHLNSDEVYAGFTAATGDCFENNFIDSWYFDSKYNPIDTENNTYVTAPTTVTVTADPAQGVTHASTIHVNVKNVDNTNAADIPVTLTTDKGNLSKKTITTDRDGNGTVTFNVDSTVSGTANIRAVAEGGAYGSCTVQYIGSPHIINSAKSGIEDQTMTFVSNDFADYYEGDTINSIKIKSLPQNGTLLYNGSNVTQDQVIPISDTKHLSFVPNTYWHGSTSFEWSAMSDKNQWSNTAVMTLNFSAVNHAPNAPGSFTSQLQGRKLKGDTHLELTWGQATDPDNDTPLTYILEFFDGVSWTQIYSGTANNFTYTLPDTTSTRNAKFRVKAEDPGKLYSGYTNSDTFTLDNTSPIISLNGAANMTVEANSTFSDPGATASDNFDGDITSRIASTGVVNTSILGDYSITYTVTDNAGNAATVTRIVHVKDTTAPIITLKGRSDVNIEVFSQYEDEGVTASDTHDGDISDRIVTTGTVNTSRLGSYTITYNVSDSSGNNAEPVTRTVHVVDTTKPVISLKGDPVVTLEVHNPYIEAGATAIDNYDGDISNNIVIDAAAVNTNVIGYYTVTYNVIDSSGNIADTVTRSVHVVDTTKPVITLRGNSSVTLEVHNIYTDEGATAMDNYDGDISSKIAVTGNVDINTLGDYTIYYNVSDNSGNRADTVTRTVHVVDTTKPVITLRGNASVTVEVHNDYIEQGATAMDNYDGDISGKIEITGTVDKDRLGDYTISYNVSDNSGNRADTVTRTVHVVDTTKPVITLNGDSTVRVEVHHSYTEQGATAMDNYDGDISSKIVNTGTVNTDVLGSYTVSYNVADNSGNRADTVIRTVQVVDTTKPVITLNGEPEVTVEVHGTYTDAGATAYDNYDGDLTSSIRTLNPVDTGKLGNYTIYYVVSDSSGNMADTVSRIVHVVDTTKPVITLKGDASVTVGVHGNYEDAGASASDNYDGDISDRIIAMNNVNTNIIGNYTVSYNVADTSGNRADTVIRTVHVIDAEKPVITLKGGSSVTVEVHNPYTDAGATAVDNYDGDISGRIVSTGTVDTEKLGEYTISYNVSDTSGNKADTVTRTVHVVDTTKPVITLKGNPSVTVEVHNSYTDAGATANDNYDGDITGKIVTTGTVNTDKLGDYTISYNISDTSGNKADTVTRTVHVVDTTKPVISLKGNAEITLEVHSTYTDAGATAIDNYDGDITGKIVTTGTVNTDKLGDYTISYNVSDTSGNKADTVTRTVHVVDTAKPVITLKGNAEITLEVNNNYTDAGAAAIDNYDGDITGNIVVTGTVNIYKLGDYTISYNVADTSGNKADTITRTVHVVDTTKPLLILKGIPEVTIELHSNYKDAGAIAVDNYDGDITSKIVTTGTVNTDKAGDYTISYNITDSSGNKAAAVTRIVHVVETATSVPVASMPQTGSLVNCDILIIIGTILSAAGLACIFRKRRFE